MEDEEPEMSDWEVQMYQPLPAALQELTANQCAQHESSVCRHKI